MNGRFALAQRGWLLHGRPYRENSVIATMLTAAGGKVTGVIHRSRGKHRSAADNLQAFQPYVFSQNGRSELKNFSAVDYAGPGFALRGRAALVGLYFNELLYLLLPDEERVAEIDQLYTASLQRLNASNDLPAAERSPAERPRAERPPAFSAGDPLLRQMREFELMLTTELGLHPGFETDAVGDPILSNGCYVFVSSTGWLPESLAATESPHLRTLRAPGHLLQAVAESDWSVTGALGLARALTAAVIDRSLEGRMLNTRQLIQQAARLDVGRLDADEDRDDRSHQSALMKPRSSTRESGHHDE